MGKLAPEKIVNLGSYLENFCSWMKNHIFKSAIFWIIVVTDNLFKGQRVHTIISLKKGDSRFLQNVFGYFKFENK